MSKYGVICDFLYWIFLNYYSIIATNGNKEVNNTMNNEIIDNEIYYGRKEEKGDFDIYLDYYLIPEKIRADYSDLMCYGIKIVETAVYEGGGSSIDIKQIDNVFYRRKDADIFMNLIMENSVTPVELRDVVEDYIVAELSI